MLQRSVSIHCKQDIFIPLLLVRAPPNHHGRHRILHVLVQNVGLIAAVYIPDTNFAIVTALCEILTFLVETDRH